MQADKATQQDLGERLGRTEAYLQVDPDNHNLLAAAIDLSLALGDIARAEQHVLAACTLYPADPFFQYRRGHVLVARASWAEAAGVFAALLSNHQDMNLAYSLANCQVWLGAHHEALTTMAPYVGAPDLTGDAVTLLVRAYHHVGDFDAGSALVDAHRERLAGDAVFLAAASLLYFDEGRVEQSAALSDAALLLGARPIEALVVNASLALGRTDAATAIERFNEVLAINPREGRSWSGLGMASLLRRDLAGAAVQLEQAVRYLPQHIGTWHALGWCKLFSQDLEGAAQAFQTALGLDRNFGESHGGVAVVAAMRGERDVAEAAIERAVRLDPEGLTARYAQMVLSGQTADPERFKAIADRLLRSRKTLSGESVADVVLRYGKE